MAQSALFVALQASIDPKDRASATSAFFLATPTGATIGMTVGSALIVAGLRKGLLIRLTELGLQSDYIQEVRTYTCSTKNGSRPFSHPASDY